MCHLSYIPIIYRIHGGTPYTGVPYGIAYRR